LWGRMITNHQPSLLAKKRSTTELLPLVGRQTFKSLSLLTLPIVGKRGF